MLEEPTEGAGHGMILEQYLARALGISQYCYAMDGGGIALRSESVQVRDDPGLIRLLTP
jgi:ABC-type branched-subunit amino acid transport system ATPase component